MRFQRFDLVFCRDLLFQRQEHSNPSDPFLLGVEWDVYLYRIFLLEDLFQWKNVWVKQSRFFQPLQRLFQGMLGCFYLPLSFEVLRLPETVCPKYSRKHPLFRVRIGHCFLFSVARFRATYPLIAAEVNGRSEDTIMTQTTDIKATLKNEILTLNDRQAAYVLQRLKEMKRDFATTEDAASRR